MNKCPFCHGSGKNMMDEECEHCEGKGEW